MSKTHENPKNEKPQSRYGLRTKIGAAAAGAAVLASGGLAAANKLSSQSDQIKSLKMNAASEQAQDRTLQDEIDSMKMTMASVQHQQEQAAGSTAKIAEQEIQAKQFAEQQAADLTKALNASIDNPSDGPSIFTQVLNGTITLRGQYSEGGKGGEAPDVKNAFLLSTLELSNYDIQGNFLAGAWVGIQSVGSDGRPTITAVPFDSDTQKFVVNEGADSPVLSAGVYATETDDGQGKVGYELIGFDPEGNNQLHNADGSIIEPGLLVDPQ